MPFLSLPLEIHHRILSYLLSNGDVAALSLQCRTLHAMCDMATRRRYHRVSVSEAEDSLDNAFELLMDILKRPTLGQYVRHVECCQPLSKHKDYEETNFERYLSNEDMNLLREAVQMGGFTGSERDQVVNMLMQRMNRKSVFGGDYRDHSTRAAFVSQALTALLVVISPHLVSMTMTTGFYREFPLFKIMSEANANPDKTPHLQNLRKVYLLNKSERLWADSRFYGSMLFYSSLSLFDNLPSIESVRVDAMEQDEDEGHEYRDKCSNISRVSILHSSVSSTYLAQVIWSCKILREFRYSIGGRASNDGGYPLFNPKTFIMAICRHKHTLEILDVDVEYQIHVLDIEDEEDRELRLNEDGGPSETDLDEDEVEFLTSVWTHTGSLREFVALKRLSLGIKFLLYFAHGVGENSDGTKTRIMLADCLPHTLEYLCIRGYQKGENPEHDEQMDALMGFYKSGKSQLKKVEGIEELIPHDGPVEDPDEDEHLLWSLDELGYEEY